jgi:4-coumarate--CoA ligase
MDSKVSAFKRITGGVVFLDAIPKNPSGKILRTKLREQAKQELKGVPARL